MGNGVKLKVNNFFFQVVPAASSDKNNYKLSKLDVLLKSL